MPCPSDLGLGLATALLAAAFFFCGDGFVLAVLGAMIESKLPEARPRPLLDPNYPCDQTKTSLCE